ncbi:MAG: glycosyltransferase [Candidatus Omnitrophota bacterium]
MLGWRWSVTGHSKQRLKKKISKYGLQNNIELFGFLDGKEKFEVFKQSKIVIHPATYDSGGMAAAEAMAWGLPGISFDLEALKTYYPKGMIKICPGDLEKFAEAVIRLLTDKKYYQETASEAVDLIVEQWDWDKRASQIFEMVLKT